MQRYNVLRCRNAKTKQAYAVQNLKLLSYKQKGANTFVFVEQADPLLTDRKRD